MTSVEMIFNHPPYDLNFYFSSRFHPTPRICPTYWNQLIALNKVYFVLNISLDQKYAEFHVIFSEYVYSMAYKIKSRCNVV